MKIQYKEFAGTGPRVAPRLLPSNFGQIARNTKLWSNELRPFYDDTFVQYVANNTNTIYKYKKQPDDETVWLSWPSDVDVVKGPIFDDRYNRIILSGLGADLRVTDSTMITNTTQTVNTSNSYTLGVPRPANNATMTVGPEPTDPVNLESRSYVVALVREWEDGKLDVGQLSNPALTSAGDNFVDVYSGQSVTLSNIQVPAGAYANSRVRYIYVYRTAVGTEGEVVYSYVDSIPVTTATVYSYVDTVATSDLQETAVSLEWSTPPSGLKGIVSMNNGVLAGFVDNDVYFSYPYQPHAWPVTYRVATDYNIVGLGCFGNGLVVCTEAAPTLIIVTDPAAPVVQPINQNMPCLSKRSIVSTAGGVIYASKNGLIRISSTEPELITDAFITRDEWIPWNPASMRATFYDGTYYCGFTPLNTTVDRVFIFDLNETNIGIVTLDVTTYDLWSDQDFGELYLVRVLDNGRWAIAMFDSDFNTRRNYTWRSRVETSDEGIATFAAARVRGAYGFYAQGGGLLPPYEYYDNNIGVLELNEKAACNDPVNIAYGGAPIAQAYITFRYYVNGRVRYEKRLTDSLPFRLPSGFRGDEFELEVVSNIPIHSIEIATSIGELM